MNTARTRLDYELDRYIVERFVMVLLSDKCECLQGRNLESSIQVEWLEQGNEQENRLFFSTFPLFFWVYTLTLVVSYEMGR